MSDENNTANGSPPPRARRSSLAGETFANLMGGGRRESMSRSASEYSPPNGQHSGQQYPGPITTAAANAQRRRLSLATLGLSGSPNQTSPFGSYNSRRDSYGTAGSDSIDESAIEDEPSAANPPPQTFARRMSFGAKALRDVRTGGGGGSPQNGTSKPSTIAEHTAPSRTQNGTISNRDAKARGLSSLHDHPPFSRCHSSPDTSSVHQVLFADYFVMSGSEGFNWSDNFRNRAERTASISGGAGMGGFGNNTAGVSPPARHDRSKSVAVMEPPAREMPKPKEQVRPDHFQERILKGDFYMD